MFISPTGTIKFVPTLIHLILCLIIKLIQNTDSNTYIVLIIARIVILFDHFIIEYNFFLIVNGK